MSDFTPHPVKPTIPFAAVEALDVRAGTIEAVNDVPGSKKLLALTVAFGDHRRTILSGMKRERPDPQELVGRQTLFIVNLEPQTMAGMRSEGMILDVGYADGLTPSLLLLERPLPDGSRAG